MAQIQISISTDVHFKLGFVKRHFSELVYADPDTLSYGSTIALLIDLIEEHHKDVPVDRKFLKAKAAIYPRRGRPRKESKNNPSPAYVARKIHEKAEDLKLKRMQIAKELDGVASPHTGGNVAT